MTFRSGLAEKRHTGTQNKQGGHVSQTKRTGLFNIDFQKVHLTVCFPRLSGLNCFFFKQNCERDSLCGIK